MTSFNDFDVILEQILRNTSYSFCLNFGVGTLNNAVDHSQLKCAHSVQTIFVILFDPQWCSELFLYADCESNNTHR